MVLKKKQAEDKMKVNQTKPLKETKKREKKKNNNEENKVEKNVNALTKENGDEEKEKNIIKKATTVRKVLWYHCRLMLTGNDKRIEFDDFSLK